MSTSVIGGFTTGSAIIISISQAKYLFGYTEVPRFVYTHQILIYLISNIGSTNLGAFAIAAVSMSFLYGGNFLLMIYICNLHVLNHFLLIYICKLNIGSSQRVFEATSSSHTDNSSSTTSDSFVDFSIHLSRENLKNSDFWAVMLLYPCLYGVLIVVSAKIFNSVARSLNDFENHKTNTDYTNRLILKIFSFRFVTVCTSLYYYAFFKVHQKDPYTRIAITLFALLTISQWWDKIIDVFFPMAMHRLRMFRMRIQIGTRNLSQLNPELVTT